MTDQPQPQPQPVNGPSGQAISMEQLRNRFGFHPGTEDTIPKHEAVRAEALGFAVFLNSILPESREKSLALTAVQEAAMWANSAVAIHGAPLED